MPVCKYPVASKEPEVRRAPERLRSLYPTDVIVEEAEALACLLSRLSPEEATVTAPKNETVVLTSRLPVEAVDTTPLQVAV